MLEAGNVNNNKLSKAPFVCIRPLYVTDMRYLKMFPEVSVSFYL